MKPGKVKTSPNPYVPGRDSTSIYAKQPEGAKESLPSINMQNVGVRGNANIKG